MTHILRLIEDHVVLDAAAATLAILAEGVAPRPETAFDELQRFRAALSQHVGEETAMIAGSTAPGLKEFSVHAEAHRDEFADLVAEWETYLHEWSEENIREDWSGFGNATRWMMARVREQIRVENAVLYPLALQHGLATLQPTKVAA